MLNNLLYLYFNLKQWSEREEGQDLVEYALLLGLISIVSYVAIQGAGQQINAIWTAITTTLAGLPTGP